jgi:UDP-N-acetylmuramoylalanine--D-glutamate ligase
LAAAMRQKAACLVCIGQTKYIFADLAKSVNIPYVISDTLNHAVHTAVDYARHLSIGTVLFSPGAASFDMFVNVYDRVEQFNQIVASL